MRRLIFVLWIEAIGSQIAVCVFCVNALLLSGEQTQSFCIQIVYRPKKSNHSVKKMNPVTLWRGERQRNKILVDGLVDFGQNTIFSWTKPWEQSGHLKTCQLKMEEHPHQLLSVRYGTGSDSDQTESQAQEPLTLDSAGPEGSPDCLLQHPDVIKTLCKS